VPTIVVTIRSAHGQVHQTAFYVDRKRGPYVGGAGVRPGVVLPSVVTQFTGLWNRMESPGTGTCSHVEGLDVPRRVTTVYPVVWHPAPKDDQVIPNDRG